MACDQADYMKLSDAGLTKIAESNGITEEQGLTQLRRDVLDAEASVNATMRRPLTQDEFDVLVDFCYSGLAFWHTMRWGRPAY
jgi:GH24 family phage-related lysozyme (muramidase)